MEVDKDAEIFGLGNALEDYKKENNQLRKRITDLNSKFQSRLENQRKEIKRLTKQLSDVVEKEGEQ